jgi:hypothetical protein
MLGHKGEPLGLMATQFIKDVEQNIEAFYLGIGSQTCAAPLFGLGVDVTTGDVVVEII